MELKTRAKTGLEVKSLSFQPIMDFKEYLIEKASNCKARAIKKMLKIRVDSLI